MDAWAMLAHARHPRIGRFQVWVGAQSINQWSVGIGGNSAHPPVAKVTQTSDWSCQLPRRVILQPQLVRRPRLARLQTSLSHQHRRLACPRKGSTSDPSSPRPRPLRRCRPRPVSSPPPSSMPKVFCVHAAADRQARTGRPSKSVNELLANLRLGSSSATPSTPRELPATAPSVPPAIRELLRLPETPQPLPRRPVR